LNPTVPAYWDNADLAAINQACFLAAIHHPNALTQFAIDRYLIVINARTAPQNRLYQAVHAALLLQNVQNHTRVYANTLRRHYLQGNRGNFDIARLALSYEEYVRRTPVRRH
jgi:hypothetical protein